MNQINREQFEAWLMSQPGDRVFNYYQGLPDHQPGCVICNFLREMTAAEDFNVGAGQININGEPTIPIKGWLHKVIKEANNINSVTLHGATRLPARCVQAAYRAQFPERVEVEPKPVMDAQPATA